MATDNYKRFVILLSHTGKPFTETVIRAHVQHLRQLDQEGKLILCGPFLDHKGGMVILKAMSHEEALAIAAQDPFVVQGFETCEVRTWQLSCEENNHLGMG